MTRPTIKTADGRYFNLVEPWRSSLSIEAMAHSLSNQCRFTGHTRVHYSVAQHCVLVSYVVDEPWALHGLLHEAAEPIVGDMSGPLKALLPAYKAIECSVEASLFPQMGLEWPPDAVAAVKHADRVVLVTEQRDLMPPDVAGGDDEEWAEHADIEPLPWTIEPLPIFVAKALFLRRFEQLGGVR